MDANQINAYLERAREIIGDRSREEAAYDDAVVVHLGSGIDIKSSRQAPRSQVGQEPQILMQTHRVLVQRFIEAVLNQGSIDSAGEFFWEDMVEQVPLPGQGPGLEGLNDVLRGMRFAFPDMKWSVEEQIAEVDKVVTRFVWVGTHRGAFIGVPATGRAVRVWGIVIDRIERGKIKETRIIMDTLGLMAQIGVVPAPGPGA